MMITYRKESIIYHWISPVSSNCLCQPLVQAVHPSLVAEWPWWTSVIWNNYPKNISKHNLMFHTRRCRQNTAAVRHLPVLDVLKRPSRDVSQFTTWKSLFYWHFFIKCQKTCSSENCFRCGGVPLLAAPGCENIGGCPLQAAEHFESRTTDSLEAADQSLLLDGGQGFVH